MGVAGRAVGCDTPPTPLTSPPPAPTTHHLLPHLPTISPPPPACTAHTTTPAASPPTHCLLTHTLPATTPSTPATYLLPPPHLHHLHLNWWDGGHDSAGQASGAVEVARSPPLSLAPRHRLASALMLPIACGDSVTTPHLLLSARANGGDGGER